MESPSGLSVAADELDYLLATVATVWPSVHALCQGTKCNTDVFWKCLPTLILFITPTDFLQISETGLSLGLVI